MHSLQAGSDHQQHGVPVPRRLSMISSSACISPPPPLLYTIHEHTPMATYRQVQTGPNSQFCSAAGTQSSQLRLLQPV